MRVAGHLPFEGLHARLDRGEQEKAERFRFTQDRDAFVAAHALLRHQLDRAAAGRHAWKFRRQAGGKPVVEEGLPQLCFSLSHCRGMVAVAVAQGLDVGVDVEAAGSTRRGEGVIDLVLAPAERAFVAAATDEATWCDRFFAFWTLKEAVIKATGQGLAADLPGFAIALTPLRLLTPGPDGSAADLWRLHRQAVDGYRLAAAARISGAQQVAFRVEEVTPDHLLGRPEA